MRLLKVDIYSFGGNVASGGFLKSQKARLLAARQISLLFVLPMTHTVASLSLLNLLLLLSVLQICITRGEKDKTLQCWFSDLLSVGLSFIDSKRCRCVMWWQRSDTKSSWTVYKFGECCETLQHLASNYIQPFLVWWPDGPAAHGKDFSESVRVFVCQTFCLNSGALPVGSDSRATPCGRHHHKKRFFSFKTQAWCRREGTKADEGARERESKWQRLCNWSVFATTRPAVFPQWVWGGGRWDAAPQVSAAKKSSSRDSSLGLKRWNPRRWAWCMW